MTDRLVLTMEGATMVCSAALLRSKVLGSPCGDPGGRWEVLASESHSDARGQGRILLKAVDDMLRHLGAAPAALGAIVVGTGPGTFTGVRIAVATARALSLALSIPVVGVSTLAALVAEVAQEAQARAIVPVVDARRGQVFYGCYEGVGDPEKPWWVRRASYGVCDRGALGALLGGPSLVVAEDESVVGELPEGVELRVAAVRSEHLVCGQRLLIEPGELPQGMRLTPWLLEALVVGKPPAPESVRPVYVRAPDADVHIAKMRDPWAPTPGPDGEKPGL